MNPLEAMAKAHWNSQADEFNGWDELDGEEKKEAMAPMRAALLALSECELPEETAQEGGIAGHVMDITAVDCFRAILRAIVNAPSSSA